MKAKIRRGFLVHWSVLALALLSLGGIIVGNLYRERAEVLSRERLHLLAQGRVITQNLGRQLAGTDRALVGIRDDLARLSAEQRYAPAKNRYLKALEEAIPGVRTLLVVDSAGVVRLSNRPQLLGADLSGREYFRSARRRADPSALYVSEPFRSLLGAWAVALVRVLPAERGGFGGIVVAALDAAYFETLLGSVNYAPDMWTAILHGGGKQFLVVPERPGETGRDLAGADSFFSRHAATGSAVEVLTDFDSARGRARLVAVETIRPEGLPLDKPFVVAVGRDRAAITAHWRENAFVQGGMLALVVFASVGGLIVFQRRQYANAREVVSAYERLEESAERLRLATEAAGMGVWEFDLRSRTLVWDPAMFEMYGVGAGEFSSPLEAWRARVLPEDADQAESELREAVRAGGPFATRFRIRRRDGEVRTIRGMARVRRDAGGRPVRVVGNDKDITDRIRARDELRLRERDLSAILENMPSMVGYWDRHQRNRFGNRAYAAWYGTDPEQMKGKTAREIVGEELYRRNLPHIEAVLRGEPQVLERTLRAPDGVTLRHCLVQYVPDVVDGQVEGFYAFLHDITAIKNAENALRESREQLFQAHKMESIGHLAAGLAHDFNNLLMVISASAEVLAAAAGGDPHVKRHLDYIESAVGRASKFTAKMLDYAGESPTFREPVELPEVAAAAAGMLRGALPPHVHLHLDPSPGAPTVLADEKQLREVVLSLLTNAWEAIGDGPGEVGVKAAQVAVDERFPRSGWVGEPLREGRYAVLEVADTGCGMDELTLERIFDPFFTTKFTGRGLELAAVLGIVRSHGGAIRVVSAPNEGTTFSILLPVELPRSAGGEAGSPKPAADATARGAGTILLVDDEQELREVTRVVLENLGFQVVTARDGVEGVEVFRERAAEISAVLLDMTMPRMGGGEALRQIRLIRPGTPVILASGYTVEQAAQRGLDPLPSAFLQKPFRAVELEATLRGVLPKGGRG